MFGASCNTQPTGPDRPVRPGLVARLVVSITDADVGQRVSLRRRLPTGAYSDVVGVLEAWSGGVLTVRRRTGELVEVPQDTLVAGKVVPPPPPKRRA